MKTDEQLTQEILQKIQTAAPVRARKKARVRVLVTALCAFVLLVPALFFVLRKPVSPIPKQSTDYSQSSEETDEQILP